MDAYELVKIGDTVWLGLNGQIARFTVHRIWTDRVALSYNFENVIYVRWVDRARLLKLLGKVA